MTKCNTTTIDPTENQRHARVSVALVSGGKGEFRVRFVETATDKTRQRIHFTYENGLSEIVHGRLVSRFRCLLESLDGKPGLKSFPETVISIGAHRLCGVRVIGFKNRDGEFRITLRFSSYNGHLGALLRGDDAAFGPQKNHTLGASTFEKVVMPLANIKAFLELQHREGLTNPQQSLDQLRHQMRSVSLDIDNLTALVIDRNQPERRTQKVLANLLAI